MGPRLSPGFAVHSVGALTGGGAVALRKRMSGRWTGFGSVLREQKLYLESLLEISPTAIVTLGLNRKITSWNLAAEELFGYTAAEAIGRNLEDLVANEEDLRAEYTAYFEERARGERFHAVTRRTRKDGTLVDVDVFAVS